MPSKILYHTSFHGFTVFNLMKSTIIELFIPFLYIWDISFTTVNNTTKKNPHTKVVCHILNYFVRLNS